MSLSLAVTEKAAIAETDTSGLVFVQHRFLNTVNFTNPKFHVPYIQRRLEEEHLSKAKASPAPPPWENKLLKPFWHETTFPCAALPGLGDRPKHASPARSLPPRLLRQDSGLSGQTYTKIFKQYKKFSILETSSLYLEAVGI